MNFTFSKVIRLCALFGGLAVILGAFGAHGLKPLLSEYQAQIYEKGVHYQFFHVVALAIVAFLLERMPDNRRLQYAVWAFMLGILFFSGSLYLLACRDLIPVPVGWVGPVTPIGGVSFIVGWLMVFLSQK